MSYLNKILILILIYSCSDLNGPTRSIIKEADRVCLNGPTHKEFKQLEISSNISDCICKDGYTFQLKRGLLEN